MQPADFRNVVSLNAGTVNYAMGKLLNSLGYSDEYVRLTKRDVKSAVASLREAADELAASLREVEDTMENPSG